MNYIYASYSPVGVLTVASDGDNITGLWIAGQKYFAATLDEPAVAKELPVFERVQKWLSIYFDGKNPTFTLPLAPKGSAFRKAVWDILCSVPYGKIITYRDIAKMVAAQMGRTTMSAQAVGGAVGHNPISLLIPCHRVVGTDGSLTGYAAGMRIKMKLLTMEGADLSKLYIP